MSYEITYRKAVVKLPSGKTVGIIESGSNNCTEIYSNRRVRDWGLLSDFVGYKADVEKYIKTRVQRYIDDNESEDCKQWNEDNRQNMNSQYRASWRFPGEGTIKSTITYLTNPNIDYDLALTHLQFKFEAEDERFGLDKLEEKLQALNGGRTRLKVYGVDNVLFEQKMRRDGIRRTRPKVIKEPGTFVIHPEGTVYGDRIFIRRLTSRAMAYTTYMDNAKRFDTEQQALKRIEKRDLNGRFGSKVDGYKVLNINDYK